MDVGLLANSHAPHTCITYIRYIVQCMYLVYIVIYRADGRSENLAPPDFGRSVNRTSTRGGGALCGQMVFTGGEGADYAYQILLAPPAPSGYVRPD